MQLLFGIISLNISSSLFNILKDHILSLIRPTPKSIFGVHHPLGFRYLFQLRVNASPLRSHKIHHNFFDTPSDICHCNQGIEDVSHFLISCPSFATQRVTLAISEIEILQRNNLNHLSNQNFIYSAKNVIIIEKSFCRQ